MYILAIEEPSNFFHILLSYLQCGEVKQAIALNSISVSPIFNVRFSSSAKFPLDQSFFIRHNLFICFHRLTQFCMMLLRGSFYISSASEHGYILFVNFTDAAIFSETSLSSIKNSMLEMD